MPKPLTGLAMLGVDALIVAAAMSGNVELAPLAATLFNAVGEPLAIAGVTTAASQLSQALGNQNSLGITTRAPAALRQIIRGTQRVGGTIVYQSTTGSSKDQYNFVIVLAGHQCWAIENLYLDGRRVNWTGTGVGNTTRNGYNFGGNADSGTYVGPNGQQYNFGGLVYCEARFGDQADQDVITGLTANDPSWTEVGGNYPWLGGCTYVYLKLEYDAAMFPQGQPEIRFTIHGKCDIMDPRTGVASFTTNPALQVADLLTDPTWGLRDNTVNQAQLIAAANVCDEMVLCAPTEAEPEGSLTEALYSASYAYDTSKGPGAVISVFLQAMGGRLTRQGAQWFIWPAYYQGPSFNWSPGILLDAPQWRPSRDVGQLFNRVRGTYIAPNYPYNVAGDLYDANGWYEGSIQNNFPFAFRPDDFPEYAQDPLHGYAVDLFLFEDSGATQAYNSANAYPAGAIVFDGTLIYYAMSAVSAGTAPVASAVAYNPLVAYTTGAVVSYAGVYYTALMNSTGEEPDTSPTYWQASPWKAYSLQLPVDINFEAVLSVAQAQRVAKIALMRNRFQGTGTLKTKMAAFAQAGIDTGELDFPALGWTSKLIELADEPALAMEDQDAGDGRVVPALALRWSIQETDPSVYEWDCETEELTVYDVSSSPAGTTYTPAAPTGMTLVSGPSTAVNGVDGIVIPRVLLEWTDPADVLTTLIQVQYRPTGSPNPWQQGPVVAVGLGACYVSGVISQAAYDFRIRGLRTNGAASAWLEIDDYTVGTTLSISSYSGIPVAAPGTLSAIAHSDGTAEIDVANFTAVYGGLSVACTPSPDQLTGLLQNALYWVYYIDPTFAGGAITPIATQNQGDFLNKPGYLLIGSITTPNYTPLYRPTSYSDVGSRATINPAAAYDGNLSTSAVVSSSWTTTGSGPFTYPVFTGDCIWAGFAAVTTSAAKTLNVLVTPDLLGGTGTGSMTVLLHGLATDPITLASYTSTMSEQTITYTIPSGTNLANVSIEIICTMTPPGSPGSGACQISDAEMWIQ